MKRVLLTAALVVTMASSAYAMGGMCVGCGNTHNGTYGAGSNYGNTNGLCNPCNGNQMAPNGSGPFGSQQSCNCTDDGYGNGE